MTCLKIIQNLQNRIPTQLFLALVILFCPAIMQAQWNYLNGPTTYEMYMGVVNPDTLVYSYGNSGKIYHSVNGGETWEEFQTVVDGSWIYEFDFPTQEIGYGCGGTYFGIYTDVIIKTVDAGMTWDTLTTNSFGVYTFNHIDFLNSDTGFVATGNLLLRTMDGGENFTPLEVADIPVFQIRALSSTTEGILFAATSQSVSQDASKSTIYRSDNLGDTWIEVYTNTMEEPDNFNNRFINKIDFPSANIGYAVGGNGLFLKTTDAGLTWTQNFISPFSGLTALDFTSTEVGYINNAGGIYKTTDGGTTWAVQNMNIPSIVYDIQFGSNQTGFALTNERLYKTTNGGEITNITEAELSNRIDIFPNPATRFCAVAFDGGTINSVKIYDAIGKLAMTLNNNFNRINISHLASGTYFLTVETNEGLANRKLVVD